MIAQRQIAGFTLIELIVVVALLAIFATIAVPGFTHFINQNRAQASNQELLSLLQFARAQAVAQRSTIRVCPQSNGWRVQTDCSAAASSALRTLENPPGISVNYSMNPAGNQILFLQNGSATAVTRLITCYQNRPRDGYTIDIARTGNVRAYARGKSSADGSTDMNSCTPS